jgi:hypothetical protein
MFTGKRFKLRTPVQAAVIVEGDGKGSFVNIPAGAIIKVKSGPTKNDGTVDVVWGGQIVAMFAIDLHLHGTEIMAEMAKV